MVGLPQAGKTTIFNALTQAGAEVGGYSASNKANLGVAPVPDWRLDKICELIPADNKVATTLNFVDVAGLAKGSSKGEGLGNKFLGHIREVDALAHIVRCFDGAPDPVSDIESVNTELMLADLEILEKRQLKTRKVAKSGDKEAQTQMEIVNRLIKALEDNVPLRSLTFDNPADKAFVQSLALVSMKPVFYICNVAEPADAESDYVKAAEEYGKKEGAPVLALAGSLENEILEITDAEERAEFMEEMGLKDTGLNRVVEAGYQLLDLATFFTAGGKENRAWTVEANTKAPRAAGKIHSDIEKGFIRAEVYHFDDLVKHKTEQAIKTAGLLRLEGKDYVVKDGDILHFRFNV